MTHPDDDQLHVGAIALSGDEPLTEELCLFVTSLRIDDRPVPAELLRRVEAHLGSQPELAARAAAMSADSELLREAAEPAARPRADFTERVMDAHRKRAPVHSLNARRLLAAAAVLLGVSMMWDLRNPAATRAGDDTASERFLVDDLRSDAFAPAQVEEALKTWLPGPLDRAPVGASGAAHSSARQER